jgi:hypothetical protein
MRACGNKSKVGRFVGGQLNHYRPRGPPTSLLASYLSYNTLHADAELDTDENKKARRRIAMAIMIDITRSTLPL